MWKPWQAPVDEPEIIERRKAELKTRKARQGHSMSLAELSDEKTSLRAELRERRADRREERQLAELARRASVSGARAKVAHDLYDSGEIRDLRIRKTRKISLLVLIPVMIAFAYWSTVGVHTGLVKLLGIGPSDPMWTGTWFVEGAIMTIVVGIIIVRAILRSAGGDLDWRATVIEWGMLSTSVSLNLAGAWPEGGLLEGAAATIAHSIGPVGAMITAVLISIIDDAVANAKPFEGRKSISDPAILQAAEPIMVEVSRVIDPEPSRDSTEEVSQDPAIERPKVSRPKRPKVVPVSQIERPKTVPPVVPEASQWEGDIVPAGRPEDVPVSLRDVPPSRPVSRPEQYERVVAAWEAERDAGRSGSVRSVADLTGVSKTSVGRILQPYIEKARANV
jgi:hypothetical protein